MNETQAKTILTELAGRAPQSPLPHVDQLWSKLALEGEFAARRRAHEPLAWINAAVPGMVIYAAAAMLAWLSSHL